MPRLRLAFAQWDFPVGALDANAERIRKWSKVASTELGADLVVFPELALSGYPPDDLLLRGSFLRRCEQIRAELITALGSTSVIFGHPYADGAVIRNSATWTGADEALRYDKQCLPNYAVFDEERYFEPGSRSVIREVAGVRVGLLICEDIWFPEPIARLAQDGAELVVVINASPFERRKLAQRLEVLRARTAETGLAIAYVHLVGGQDDVVYDGQSMMLNADGTLAALAPAFEDLAAVIEFDAERRVFRPPAWSRAPLDAGPETIFRALVRATRDYARKNGFERLLLGLSGGIDSALCLEIAAAALGPEQVLAVRLPSRYTSTLSMAAAAAHAARLGVRLETLSIEPAFTAFGSTLAPVFGDRPPDVSEENLQSRCRGVLLMALSNKLGPLLLSTGNKSELAVGYSTLYGDLCGGFAPLKDVYKTEVYELARWLNRAEERIPWAVIERPPSAELRPGQTDQDTLPPYEWLDAILRLYIEGEQGEEEIIEQGYEPEMVRAVLRRVTGNEYKRRQAPPGPRVSSKAFGRDRRYPITSSFR